MNKPRALFNGYRYILAKGLLFDFLVYSAHLYFHIYVLSAENIEISKT